MFLLDFDIDCQELHIKAARIAAGTRNYLEARFRFSPDWDGLIKTITFRHGDELLSYTVSNDNTVSDIRLDTGGIWSVCVSGSEPDSTRHICTNVQKLFVYGE